MTESLRLALALPAGIALGVMFFGGLWWTIQRGTASASPVRWFFGSLLLRMSLTLAGLYYAAGHNWLRLLVCLLGFVMARLAVTWLTRPVKEILIRPGQEAGHAA